MATNGHAASPPPSDPRPPPPAQVDPEVPLTSAQDDGLSKRPRDARMIHLVLSQLGIHSYQERVPLQLLDFAYRYTSGMLSDSLRLSAEGYSSQADRGNKRGGDEGNAITLTALRQAIASRQGHTFAGPLPKEFMMEEAAERNRIALPKVERSYGVQLPPEKYCLTGIGWGIKDEWDSEEEILDADDERPALPASKEDDQMGGMDDAGEEGEDDEEGAGRMEDVFGEDSPADAAMDQD